MSFTKTVNSLKNKFVVLLDTLSLISVLSINKTHKHMKTTLKDFNTSVHDLKSRERNGERIEQSHFGDFLMIEEDENNERYRVWLNHPENVKQGESVWQIEYCGKSNRYTWKTVARGND